MSGAVGSSARPAPAPERALLDLLGLAARARALVHGTDMTRRAARDGEVRSVILAADTSPTQTQKLVPLLEARGIPFAICLGRDAIGGALGKSAVSAVGITNDSFARRALELAAALSNPRD
ncbi:MAG TPA: ribosomal L7Ae/L30e/S12e/Gadd45 family protein [Longimicrobium sp.]|nr:ribosomal L7Ae/L30e/S12e/Gadd45 family protein [Longimicrobium sp.]